jgi:ABC-type multidrug transport system fused ATPase/permease subunit
MIKQILFLFSKAEKKNFFILLLLITLMNIVDILGIASVVPFVVILTNPEILNSNSDFSYYINQLKIFFVINTHFELVFLTGCIFLFFLISSIVFKSIVVFLQIKFSYMREHSICERLTLHYARQNYVRFLNRNSADLTKNILSETGQIIFSSIFGIINLISQIILILLILTLLFIVNPKVTMILLFIFSFTYGLIIYLIKKYKKNFSDERLEENKNRFLALSELFKLIKLVKINSKEYFFTNRFSKASLKYAKNVTFAQSVGMLPRYLVELVAFGGAIIFILISMKNVGNFYELIPSITLFIFAGYKLLPSMQQAYQSTIQMKHTSSGLKNLYEDLRNNSTEDFLQNSDEFKFEKYLKLKNISFQYTELGNLILKNINIQIPAFSKVGILGESGSGKSTLIDIILGLLNLSSGELIIDGVVVSEKNKKKWQSKIGYVPQQVQLLDASIAENIAFGIDISKIDMKKIEEVSRIANLHDFVKQKLSKGYDTIVGENGARISGGQKQRIAIARSLYHDPSVIIFDEATSSLDPFNERVVLDAINNLQRKITIISITHKLSTVKNYDLIYLLEKGKIELKGTYGDIQKIYQEKNKKFK